MQGLDSFWIVFLYFKRFDMKQTTLNLPLYWQGSNSNDNLFWNIALNTKMGHSFSCLAYVGIFVDLPHTMFLQ